MPLSVLMPAPVRQTVERDSRTQAAAFSMSALRESLNDARPSRKRITTMAAARRETPPPVDVCYAVMERTKTGSDESRES